MSRGYSSWTDSTIVLVTGGTYTGDGLNGWSGGTTYSFACKGRRTPLNRPEEDTTDTGYKSQVPGPLSFGVSLDGYFKSNTGLTGTPTIPPVTMTDAFVKIVVTIGFSLTAVVMVKAFDPNGTIGSAQSWHFEAITDGTFTYA